jgi:ketosteroid isomerase-like protein
MLKKLFLISTIVIASSLLIASCTPETADDHAILEAMLTEFLDGASVNDIEIHDSFWSDDLIYTSSAGLRYGKSRIMDGLRESDPDQEPAMRYHAEEIQIRQYGNTAVVAFQLVGTDNTTGDISRFWNSGTFLKESGEWRVVNWQATHAAVSED